MMSLSMSHSVLNYNFYHGKYIHLSEYKHTIVYSIRNLNNLFNDTTINKIYKKKCFVMLSDVGN